uniref:Uncharacterized protein n=1 Tax=Parascaris univalens TaxID=6257 RepID=A0A915ACU2_PARUN
MDSCEQLSMCGDDTSPSMLRLELESVPELCVHLFVPDPEKREIEFCFRGEIAASLLRSFCFGEVPTFLIDVLEMSKVCLFCQGCIPLLWDGRIQMLHPSMRTLFCDAQLVAESVSPLLRCTAESAYWEKVGPPSTKKAAFWSPEEEVTRKFLMKYDWRALRQLEQSNVAAVAVLRTMSAATKRLRQRLELRYRCRQQYHRPTGSTDTKLGVLCKTPIEIAERRWKENEKTNDKLYDGVLFKNVPDGQEGVSNWEVNVSRDGGYTCWGQISVSSVSLGHVQSAQFALGTQAHLSSFLTHLVGLFATRNSDPTLAHHLTRAELP